VTKLTVVHPLGPILCVLLLVDRQTWWNRPYSAFFKDAHKSLYSWVHFEKGIGLLGSTFSTYCCCPTCQTKYSFTTPKHLKEEYIIIIINFKSFNSEETKLILYIIGKSVSFAFFIKTLNSNTLSKLKNNINFFKNTVSCTCISMHTFKLLLFSVIWHKRIQSQDTADILKSVTKIENWKPVNISDLWTSAYQLAKSNSPQACKHLFKTFFWVNTRCDMSKNIFRPLSNEGFKINWSEWNTHMAILV